MGDPSTNASTEERLRKLTETVEGLVGVIKGSAS